MRSGLQPIRESITHPARHLFSVVSRPGHHCVSFPVAPLCPGLLVLMIRGYSDRRWVRGGSDLPCQVYQSDSTTDVVSPVGGTIGSMVL